MPRTLVIYNPVAGRGRAARQWPAVAQALRTGGLEFEVAITQKPRDATRLAAQVADRYTMVVAVGGDGTAHEVANGLLRASGERETTALGLVPLGNGDDFAKIIPPQPPIGGQPFDWRAAVSKLTRPVLQTRLYDVGRMVSDRSSSDQDPVYWINVMDVGFGARAALATQQVSRHVSGFAMYAIAILQTLYRYQNPRLRLQLDDEPGWEQRSTIAAVSNGRCLGNRFWIAPQARADDGWFDVMIADAVNRRTILRLIPKLMQGTHLGEPVIKVRRTKRIVIDSSDPLVVETDGEIPYRKAHHLEIEMLHRRLRVIV